MYIHTYIQGALFLISFNDFEKKQPISLGEAFLFKYGAPCIYIAWQRVGSSRLLFYRVHLNAVSL